MKRISIALSGCLGKMGLAVTDVVKDYLDINIIAGIARIKIDLKTFPILDDFIDLKKIKDSVDAILDFSHPDCLDRLLEYAIDQKIPLVICTTGYNKNQKLKIEQAAKVIPIFFSSNTSLGIGVLIEIAKIAKSILRNGYDIEIIEKHHNRKIDAPSGTALMIAKAISEDSSEYVYDRTNRRGRRQKNEIGIHTVRCGEISGEHEILISGEYETLILKHVSHSRKLFAHGALNAVRFIINKSNGLYSIKDVVNSSYSYY